jgi:DNA-directed RNA polymerase subunit RPC12/RpoP
MSSLPPDAMRVAEARCLECGHTFNAIGTGDGRVPDPQPGDPVACIDCGAVMTFEDGKLRGFTEAEAYDLIADRKTLDDLARLVRNIHLLRAGQN